MSKLKKLGIVLIVAIIAILGMNIKSNAYHVGQKITMTYSKYLSNDNIFCVEHRQALRGVMSYKIISKVDIEGRKSTDHKGNTRESWHNAKMLAILSADNGSSKQSGKVQNAIWNYAATWMSKVGKYHAGLYRGFASNVHGKSTSLDSSSSKQANNEETIEIKDKTNKDKIKLVSYEKDGNQYVRIGPFNWTFTGKLSKATVYDQNGKAIDGVLYSIFSGKTQKWIDVEDIKSGKNFYISVLANKGTTQITKISAKVKGNVNTVTVWFLESRSGAAYQNLIIREPHKKSKEMDMTFNYDIKLYVKLSGYVWVDGIAEKTSKRNYLFKENDYENNDILLDGITVRLKDKATGENVQTTTTSNLGRYKDSNNNGHGEYLFEKVPIEKLGDYYIEFEYDGLTYTNVTPHIEKDNGSKSSESATVRNNFNMKFSSIEGSTQSTGITRDANGNVAHNLSYNIDELEHTATIIKSGQFTITSNTNSANYSIEKHYTGQEEIKYINLGLYEREQPNIAVVKDIENVRVSINKKEHTYLYAQRNINAGDYKNGFNIGVKFGNEYGKLKYSRPVYKADYEYINPNESIQDQRELRVYVTYKIAMNNQSTNLITKVNSIVDYYDANYSLESLGTSLDEKGNPIGDIQKPNVQNYNDEYNKIVINTNTEIAAQKVGIVYVQFALNREAVLKILNNQENLDNVVEVNSYSVFDENRKVYAGIDINSNPGNAIPGDIKTYEDDTDKAPGLQLEVADSREMSGKVFLDSTSGELKTGQIRQGDGIYNNEIGIKDVAIKLTENSGTGKVYTATTNGDGDFYISNFIPGDYTLTYTWGDETYTVQNYKGTIYNEPSRQNNDKWYKQEEPRYSDAIDNYETRINIDEELKTINKNTQITITKMDSTTPKMGLGVEFDSTITDFTEDRFGYKIKHIDFGIVERARQDIELTKRVKTLKITLANGQVITDVSIDDEGNMTGEKQHVTYMKPSEQLLPKNGFVRVELDNELIQGAKLDVTYEIKVTNISELDYLSENYYKYGTIEGEVIKLETTGILDYLDSEWAYEEHNQWQVKTLEQVRDIITDEVYNSEAIKDRTILYTDITKGQKLEPTQSTAAILNISKILSNKGEINLNNEAEVVEVVKDGGSHIISNPGDYIPGQDPNQNDSDMAPEVIVTPDTGANLNWSLPIIVVAVAGIVLGVGIIFIKKKTLKKE